MRRIALTAIILIALAGCNALEADVVTAPSLPSTSATPTPEETVDSEPVALQLSVSGVAAVDASGAVLDHVEFDQPVADVVLLISETVNESAMTQQHDLHPCSDASEVTRYSWHNFAVLVNFESNPSSLATWRSPNSYSVSFISATVNGIELRGAEGIRVGDDASALVASLPTEQITSTAVWMIVDDGGTYTNSMGSGSWGLAASADGGIVSSWSSPTYLLDAFC